MPCGWWSHPRISAQKKDPGAESWSCVQAGLEEHLPGGSSVDGGKWSLGVCCLKGKAIPKITGATAAGMLHHRCSAEERLRCPCGPTPDMVHSESHGYCDYSSKQVFPAGAALPAWDPDPPFPAGHQAPGLHFCIPLTHCGVKNGCPFRRRREQRKSSLKG